MEAVAERFIQAYFEDMARLNVKEADAYPRATHTLDGIKALCTSWNRRLRLPSCGGCLLRGAAVCGYGKLSGRKLEDLRP